MLAKLYGRIFISIVPIRNALLYENVCPHIYIIQAYSNKLNYMNRTSFCQYEQTIKTILCGKKQLDSNANFLNIWEYKRKLTFFS